MAEQMERLNDAFKALRKESDATKRSALARSAQEAIAEGLGELPELVKKMPEGPEKLLVAAQYRKMMGQLYLCFCELEEACLNGNDDEVAAQIEKIRELKKSGHNRFMED